MLAKGVLGSHWLLLFTLFRWFIWLMSVHCRINAFEYWILIFPQWCMFKSFLIPLSAYIFPQILGQDQFKCVEKIKTISTTYMAAAGLNDVTTPHGDAGRMIAIAEYAFALQKQLDYVNSNSWNDFKLRIGKWKEFTHRNQDNMVAIWHTYSNAFPWMKISVYCLNFLDICSERPKWK